MHKPQRAVLLVSFSFLLTALGAVDRAPVPAGTMAMEATTNLGYNFENLQSGFSQNFYIYFATQLMDWTKVEVNKEADGPAGYFLVNGGGFNLVQNLDSSNAGASWGTMAPDIGWDKLEAGITAYPYYLAMFKFNPSKDTISNPDVVPDYAGLEGVWDRSGSIEGLSVRFPNSSSAVRANWPTTGGLELGMKAPLFDLGLIVGSRKDVNYLPIVADQGTVRDYRNNWVASFASNWKKSAFGVLPLQVQFGGGAALFTERTDLAGGLRVALDQDLPFFAGGVWELFSAGDVLSTQYDSKNPARPSSGTLFDWEATGGVIAFFSPNSGWKQERTKPGTKGNSAFAYSGGNHYSSFWRRWHDYGQGATGFPGVSLTGQVSAKRTTVAGKDTASTRPEVNLLLEGWEWDGKEGADKNWGLATELRVLDIQGTGFQSWAGKFYASYRTDDEVFEPYGYTSWGKDRTAGNSNLILAAGVTGRFWDNSAVDLRYQSSNLNSGASQDAGLINLSLTVFY